MEIADILTLRSGDEFEVIGTLSRKCGKGLDNLMNRHSCRLLLFRDFDIGSFGYLFRSVAPNDIVFGISLDIEIPCLTIHLGSEIPIISDITCILEHGGREMLMLKVERHNHTRGHTRTIPITGEPV